MFLEKKTHCPRPGCEGNFVRILKEEVYATIARDCCDICNYEKTTFLNGQFAGHIEYKKDGKNVKFTDERR